jgi:hypothetical protein
MNFPRRRRRFQGETRPLAGAVVPDQESSLRAMSQVVPKGIDQLARFERWR